MELYLRYRVYLFKKNGQPAFFSDVETKDAAKKVLKWTGRVGYIYDKKKKDIVHTRGLGSAD